MCLDRTGLLLSPTSTYRIIIHLEIYTAGLALGEAARMDAHSVSCSSAARFLQSRIYEDLKALGRHAVGHSQPVMSTTAGPVAVSPDAARSADMKAHVGVVGAGLAGLRCADILLRLGFRVTVLEGRGRIGGRLHQERLSNGHLVDMGPNWIHGTKDNPMLDLAKYTRTSIGTWDTRSYLFDEHGALVPLEDGESISKTMWGIIEDAFDYSNQHCQDIDPDESLLDFFRRRIVDVVPDTVDGYEARRLRVMQMAELWGAFVGSPIQRQSLKFFWLEECIEGGQFASTERTVWLSPFS